MTHKLTFKKTPAETGLAGVARPGHLETAVKADGLVCGYLRCRVSWKFHLAVNVIPTKELPADFKWITFKAEFATEPEARAWVQRVWLSINESHKIHRFKD